MLLVLEIFPEINLIPTLVLGTKLKYNFFRGCWLHQSKLKLNPFVIKAEIGVNLAGVWHSEIGVSSLAGCTLFRNESIMDINYPELLTAFYHYIIYMHIKKVYNN